MLDVAAALVAASLFATSVWLGGWWTVGDAVSIGPLGTRQCFGGECRTVSLAWVGGSVTWHRAAAATWGAGLVAMAALIGIAAARAAGKSPTLVAKTTLVSIATAVVAASYFVIAFPATTGASIGHGVALYGGAVAFGVFAPIRILRNAV